MNRRSFLNVGIGLSLVSLLPNKLAARNEAYKATNKVIKPARLNLGDKIGLHRLGGADVAGITAPVAGEHQDGDEEAFPEDQAQNSIRLGGGLDD